MMLATMRGWVRGLWTLIRFFLLGDSSGGNMANHMAVRLRPGLVELKPVQVRVMCSWHPLLVGV